MPETDRAGDEKRARPGAGRLDRPGPRDVQKILGEPVEADRQADVGPVPAALEDLQAGAGDPLAQIARAVDGDDAIVVTVDDQHGAADAVEQRNHVLESYSSQPATMTSGVVSRPQPTVSSIAFSECGS